MSTTSLTSGEAVPSSGPAVPSPSVPSPAVDSTAASSFPSSAAFYITNDDDGLPVSIKTIWEYSHCELYYESDKQGWKCLWCGNFQNGRHHTCSVSHFAKQKGWGIAFCYAVIPPAHAALYAKLYQAGTINSLRNKNSTIMEIGLACWEVPALVFPLSFTQWIDCAGLI